MSDKNNFDKNKKINKKINLEEKENLKENLENLEEDLEEDLEDLEEDLEEEDTEFDIMFKNTANKHKLEGTHALKRDTIFMGKIDKEDKSEDYLDTISDFNDDNYDLEKGSSYEMESRHYEDYYYKKSLVKDIYDILDKKTEINFIMNRRKPNKQTFNKYYKMCIDDLKQKYTKSEIFVELSYYFTDNIFNMFKLLNKKNATGIILELKEKGYLDDIGNINFI